jgi:hypothetical protein
MSFYKKGEVYDSGQLPYIDQEWLKKGKCPWCLQPIVDGSLTRETKGDYCPTCGDEFIGTLTIED